MAPPVIDEMGNRYGRWSVFARDEMHPNQRRARWWVRCECGTVASVLGTQLRSGQSQSCGCARIDAIIESRTVHGMHGHELYGTWLSMRNRCNNSNTGDYKYYGGRGIRVCPRWDSFELFVSDVGTRPSGMTLDRIDVNGDYEPGNVRWATDFEQAANKRPRSNQYA